MAENKLLHASDKGKYRFCCCGLLKTVGGGADVPYS